MYQIIELLVLILASLIVFQWLFRKWAELDLEEKKHDIEKTEEKYAEVEKIQKKHPDYDKKKKEINKFEGK